MNPRRRNTRYRQHGIAAVEFALMLPVLILLLALPLYFGRIMWHYATIQKAAQNGARFLASVPLATIKDPAMAGYVTQLTSDIVQAHLADLNPGDFPPAVDIQCNGVTCIGFSTPTTVRVVVRANIQDSNFPEYTQMAISITADANVAYLGK